MPISANRTKIYFNRWIKRKILKVDGLYLKQQSIWHDNIMKK